MTNFRNNHYIVHEAACEICAAPVSYMEFLDQQKQTSLVCRSMECGRIIANKETNPFLFRFEVKTYQKAIDSRRVHQAYRDGIRKKELSENQHIFHSVLDTLPQNLRRALHVVSIPTGLSTPHSLSEDRLATYKAHLEAVIAKVYSGETSEVVVNPENMDIERAEASTVETNENASLKAMREQLCGICKGGCCARGANHAYISDVTIKRVRETQPDLSAEELLDEYTSRAIDQPVEESCINQTQTGCGLPRRLRSDVCNDFFCPDLRKLPDKIETGSLPVSVLAIQRSNTLWRRFDESFENEITGVLMVQEEDIQLIDFYATDRFRGAPTD